MIEFFYECEPHRHTAQAGNRVFLNRKTGKHFVGKNKKSKAILKEYTDIFKKWRPSVPFGGPVQLSLHVIFPWLKSTPKRIKEKGLIPKDTKPDCDNIQKQICDALEWAGYFEIGDQQICQIKFKKSFGDRSGIEVKIDEL